MKKLTEELLTVKEKVTVRGLPVTATVSALAPSSSTKSWMPATDTNSLTRRLTTWEGKPSASTTPPSEMSGQGVPHEGDRLQSDL